MRKIIPWLITLIGCFAVTAALAAVKYQQISAAIAFGESFPEPYEVVDAMAVAEVDYVATRRLTGTVRAPEFLEIAPSIGGRIVSIPHSAGSVVDSGDTIVELFSEDLSAQKEALIADRELTNTQLKRSRRLQSESLISQNDVDVQEARLKALSAQIDALSAQISQLTITAPFTGRLGIFTQVTGDMLTQGTVFSTLTGLSAERWIDFEVPQGLVDLSIGNTVNVYDINSVFRGQASVIAVSPALNPRSRTFTVRAMTDQITLRHGELVQVEIATRDSQRVLSLPNRSIRWDTEGTYVYLLEDAEPGAQKPFRAKPARVTLIGESSSDSYFTADFAEGTLVATAGSFKLSDGILAKLSGS